MTFAVKLEQSDHEFIARLYGDEAISGHGPTREKAIESLRAQIAARIAGGELTFVDVPLPGIHPLAGIWKDDPTVDDFVKEIYSLRDAEKPE